VEFISFKEMYPRFAYPGGDMADDPTFPLYESDRLHVRRKLTWYNPFTWISEGLLTKADLLHAQWWSMPLAPIYATIALAFKLRRKPVLFTVHNVTDHEGSVIFRAASRILFKLADHLIVHTAINQRTLIHEYGIDPARTSVIPHGSLDFQVTCSVNRVQIRHEMGFSPDDKVVLFFGTIRPYKGLATAIKAIGEVKKVLPQVRLLIAGKLWEPWSTYKKLIDELQLANHVKTFLDYIPSKDVHRYFCAADLTVLPYLHFDSQSGVGSTAVAFRTPMIVSEVGGLPELVQDRRCVVPPGDSAALGHVIADCLATPEKLESMTRHLDLTAHELDWGVIAKNNSLLYAQLMEMNRDFTYRR
jgi:glycosyltransferase involved in cell wall biosynthesis